MPDQPAPNLEEARRIAEDFIRWWGGNVDFAAAADPRTIKLARAYLTLLSEREAREEALHAAPLPETVQSDTARYELWFRKYCTALPATESAQAETDRDRNSGHSPEEVAPSHRSGTDH